MYNTSAFYLINVFQIYASFICRSLTLIVVIIVIFSLPETTLLFLRACFIYSIAEIHDKLNMKNEK